MLTASLLVLPPSLFQIDLPKVDESKRTGHVEIAAGVDTTSQPGSQASS